MKYTTNQTDASAPAPVFLDTADIARRWHCSEAHARRMIESGRLPATNIGMSKRRARWRITLSDLEAYERAARFKGR